MSNKITIKTHIAQLRNRKLWIDSVPIGLAIFGVISATASIMGYSLRCLFNSVPQSIIFALAIIAFTYIIVVFCKWCSA